MVGGIAKAVCVAGDGFDDAIGALDAGAYDSRAEEGQDFRRPEVDGGRKTFEFCRAGVGAGGVEAGEPVTDCAAVGVGAGQAVAGS